MIITIDGPAGTGKSTTAKLVAEKLGMVFVDTGAMYRTITYLLMEQGLVNGTDEEIADCFKKQPFKMLPGEKGMHYFVGDLEVTDKIRLKEVTEKVSEVAARQVVREEMWKLQRAIGEKTPSVFEGRDMGSVVFPAAELKIFLTANPEVRAQRRYLELQKTGKAPDKEQVQKELIARDKKDSERELAPLCKPEGAVEVDTSYLKIDQVVSKILKEAKTKGIKGFYWRKAAPFAARLLGRSLTGFFKFFYRHKVIGVENLIPGGAIIAPNHASFIDPPLVVVSIPYITYSICIDTMFKNWFLGWLLPRVYVFPISQSGTNSALFKAVKKIVDSGNKVQLYPEGERCLDGEIHPGKAGVGLLAAQTEAPVIPVYVHGTYEIWKRYQKRPKLFGHTACVFGKPLYWGDYAHLPRKEAIVAITEDWYKSVCALKESYLKR